MSTLLISAMIIAGTIGVFLLFIAISNKSAKERNKALLNRFYQAGAACGLRFSSQEILAHKIIGLDGINQQLLILDTEKDAVSNIALEEVSQCSIKKEFENVDFGNDRKSDIEKELRSTGIQFSFKNNKEMHFVSFYESRLNSIYERAELEAKAMHWQAILSKLAVQKTSAVA